MITNNVQLQAIRKEYNSLNKAIEVLSNCYYSQYTGVLFEDKQLSGICDNLEQIQDEAYNTLRLYEKMYINEHLKQ